MTSPSLRGDRAFLRFQAAACVSLAGTMVTDVALPIVVYRRTGSAAETSLIVALQIAPYLLFGLVAGAVADRTDRRRLMVACDVISALLVASVPLAAFAGHLGLAQLYVVATGIGVTFVWFDAANFGALPTLVGTALIADAQGRLFASFSALQIAGPAVGGLLVSTIGPAPTLWLDAVSYAASAALLVTLDRPLSAGPGSPGREAPPSPLRAQVLEGLRYLWGQRLIRAFTLLGMANGVAGGALLGLLVVDANRQLGLSTTSPLIGVLYASGAAGALLASLASPRLVRRTGVINTTLLALATAWLLLIGFAVATEPLAGAALYLAFSAANQLVIMNGIIYRQQVTPLRLQGRVNVVARMLAISGQPVGAIAGGLIAGASSVRLALLVASVGVGAALLGGLVGPLRLRGDGRD